MTVEKNTLNSESGGIFVELAIVTPLALSIWMFLVDFYMLSRTTTSMMQAAREVGIYFATDQGYQGIGQGTMTISHQGTVEWHKSAPEHYEALLPECDLVYSPGKDPMKEIADRSYYVLEGQGSFLNMTSSDQSGFEITSNNDGNKVQLTITGKLNSFFFYKNKSLQSSVVLRRMGPNCIVSNNPDEGK